MTAIASLRLFDVVLWLHITSVVIAFGVTFTYPVIVPLTLRTAPRQAAWLHRMQEAVGRRIVNPFAGLLLLTGIYLAADADVFDEWWVGVPIVVILVLFGLRGAYFAPREQRLAELAERDIVAAGEGEVVWSEEYEELGRQVGSVGALFGLLVVVTIFIMVVGPVL
jgi:tetrahydromethanopterin S-methyltransferase subunit G